MFENALITTIERQLQILQLPKQALNLASRAMFFRHIAKNGYRADRAAISVLDSCDVLGYLASRSVLRVDDRPGSLPGVLIR